MRALALIFNKSASSIGSVLLILGSMLLYSCEEGNPAGPFFATGIKIGEVTQTSAIVWARLTKNEFRVGNGAPIPTLMIQHPELGKLVKADSINNLKKWPDIDPVMVYPEGYTIESIEGACPGSSGEVMVKYKTKGAKEWTALDWKPVEASQDYAIQFSLDGLEAGNDYELLVEARPSSGENISAAISGEFRTAPKPTVAADVNFVVVTCTAYRDVDSPDGFKLYPSALEMSPDFFVHTGDIIYYDRQAKTPELARWHWDRMYSLPNHVEFHRQVASYFIKDDHDTWMNDAYEGQKSKYMGSFTYEQGTQFFLDEVPMGEKTYRTVRWGKDVQLWLMEGRDFRSPNTMEDGPEKTIWGEEQYDWFVNSVENSDATFKLLVSPTPLIGPDRENNKADNHANSSFSNEGGKIRDFISKQQNMYIVCGDRHWQYVSKDLETGVIEVSVGPGSDEHAQGWKQDNVMPEHLYLNVVGGFVKTEVSRKSGTPTIRFNHYSPDGELLNTIEFEAS